MPFFFAYNPPLRFFLLLLQLLILQQCSNVFLEKARVFEERYNPTFHTPIWLHMNTYVKLSDIAARIGGTVLGDRDTPIKGICAFDEEEEGCISFTLETLKKKINTLLKDTTVSAVIVKNKVDTSEIKQYTNLILVEDPLAAVVTLVPLFYTPPEVTREVSDKADIHPTAQIGEGVSIGAFSVIGPGAVIGDEATIHPHVTVYEGAKIGPRAIVHSGAAIRERCCIGADSIVQNGAVIGADGFGYIPDETQGLRQVPQIGVVTIADNVEVGANSCIDRATFGTTVIGKSTKIDNLVQVGHNTKIGQRTILCGHTAIAGSCNIGNDVVFGGKAGMSDHRTIPDGCRIAAGAGVDIDLTKKGDYGGPSAIPSFEYKRQRYILRNLHSIIKELQNSRHIEDEEK